MGRNNFLFVRLHRSDRELRRFCMVAQSDFEPMMMEITGFIFNPFLPFLTITLGCEGRQQPPRCLIPKSEAQGLPISLNDWLIIQSFFHNGGDCSISARFRSPWQIYLLIFYGLASDICSVKGLLCLFVKFAVDGVLGFFDGVCCGDEHIDTSAV